MEPKARKIKKNIFKYLAPAIAWGIFLSLLSLLPGKKVPEALKGLNDKMIHAGMYFILTVLILLGVSKFKRISSHKPFSLTLLVFLCSLYGGLIEILQGSLIPNRSADWQDFWSNTLGSLLGVILFMAWAKRAK